VDSQHCDSDDDLINEFPEYNIYAFESDQDINQIPDELKGGIAYIKVPKTGSSTWAGIMRRIGSRHGLKHVHDGPSWIKKDMKPSASVWANHGHRISMERELFKLMPNATYVTLIRDPVDRALSQFYHIQVSRRGVKDDDSEKTKYLSKTNAQFQMQYIQQKEESQTPAEIMESYTFIGVTERFDESLLILGRKLGLNNSDLLYLRSKESGKKSSDAYDRGKTTAKHPPFAQESDAVHAAALNLQSSGDVALHQLANAALDKAISEYHNFEKDLKEFQTVLNELEDTCRSRFEESCLWNDNGCAQDCINDYVLHRK
jgi:hypothetical protein